MNNLYWIPAAAVGAAALCALLRVLRNRSAFSACFSTRFLRGKRALRERFENILSPRRRRGTALVACVLVLTVVTGACLSFTPKPKDESSSSSLLTVSSAVSSRPVSSAAVSSAVSEVVYSQPVEPTREEKFARQLGGTSVVGITQFGDQLVILDSAGLIYYTYDSWMELYKQNMADGKMKMPEPIAKMANCLFIGESGTLYLWVEGLQLDPYGGMQGRPIESGWVTIPFAETVERIIAFSRNDYLLVTAKGELYTVGEMSLFGECAVTPGSLSRTELYTPQKLTLPEPLTDVFCNTDNTRIIALGESGTVYQAPFFMYHTGDEGQEFAWSQEVSATLPLSRTTQVFRPVPLEMKPVALSVNGRVPYPYIVSSQDGSKRVEFTAFGADGTLYAACTEQKDPIRYPITLQRDLASITLAPVTVGGENVVDILRAKDHYLYITESYDCYMQSIKTGSVPEKTSWGKVYDPYCEGSVCLFRNESGELCSFSTSEFLFYTERDVLEPKVVKGIDVRLPME